MSNFTRSILYSTSVLVAGLVAIFAIYSNVATTPDGSSVAQISPAAGGSDLGISIDTPLDNMSSDTQSLIGPESYDVDDAMQKAVDQIDSTINEFEAIESTTDDDKGTYYSTGTSYKVAGSRGEIDALLNNGLDTAYGFLNTKLTSAISGNIDPGQLSGMMNSAINQSITDGLAEGRSSSGYVGQRVVSYRCRIGRDNDYQTCTTSGRDGDETCTWHTGANAYTENRDIYDGNIYSGSRGYSGYDNYYWGTCHRRTTFQEDMAYNDAQTRGSVLSSLNSAVSSVASGGAGSGFFDPSDFTSAFNSAKEGALSDIPFEVKDELDSAIEEELSSRVFSF